MANYIGSDAESLDDWIHRYPVNVVGGREWQQQPGPEREGGSEFVPRADDGTRSEWMRPDDRPRVFVSHRRNDTEKAERVAWLSSQEGFEFWLDIYDPTLDWLNSVPSPGPLKARAIANTIEMALLNCTHVCAIWTDLTPGSTWVPYEYGRVKDQWPVSHAAGTWTSLASDRLPSYMHLGQVARSEGELTRWFAEEMDRWTRLGGHARQDPWGRRAEPRALI